jgi:hypothetical protein
MFATAFLHWYLFTCLSSHCAEALLLLHVIQMYTDLDHSLVSSTFWYQERMANLYWKKFLALGVCRWLPAHMLERWLHLCRVRITFTLLPTNFFVQRTAILERKRAWPQEKSEFALAQRSPHASAQKVHRLRVQPTLHFNTRNT